MTILPKKKLPLYEVENFNNFRQMLDFAKEKAGDTIAVKYKEWSAVHDVTYNELSNRVDALGTSLSGLDGGLGHVAIVGENSYNWICACLTVLCSQGAAVPVDRELPFEKIIEILNQCDCTTVFFDRSFEESFEKNLKYLPKIKNYICFQLRAHEENGWARSYESLVYQGEMALHEGCTLYTSLEPSDEETRMLMCTRGKEGDLRVAMLSQFSLRSATVGVLQLAPMRERCVSVLPYDRPLVLVSGLLGAFHSHTTVCIGADSENLLKHLQCYKPEDVFLSELEAEKLWQKIVRNVEKQGRTETMEKLVKTGAAMRKVGIDKRRIFFAAIHEMFGGKLETIRIDGTADEEMVRFFDGIGIAVLGGYGMAECVAISLNREKFSDFDSAGVLLPCMQVKIDNPDSEGVGEVCVRGDILMTGYYKNEEATREVLELSGWFHTGDLGKVSAQGQLRLTEHLPGKPF